MTSATPTRMAAWLESAWLARYLDRQLEGEELAWFEGYLLDKPELVEAVEVDNSLSAGLTTLNDNRGPRAFKNRFVTSKFRRQFKLGGAVAMALIIGVFGGWLLGESNRDPVLPNPTRIVLDTLRGTEAVPRVEKGSVGPYVLVEVAVPADAENIILELPGADDLALVPSPDGFVSFLILRREVADNTGVSVAYIQEGRRVKRGVDFNSVLGGRHEKH